MNDGTKWRVAGAAAFTVVVGLLSYRMIMRPRNSRFLILPLSELADNHAKVTRAL